MSFHRLLPYNELPTLPGLGTNFEKLDILRSLYRASRSLADVKAFCRSNLDMAFYTETLLLTDAVENVGLALKQEVGTEVYEAIAAGATDREPLRSVFACKNALHHLSSRIKGRQNPIFFLTWKTWPPWYAAIRSAAGATRPFASGTSKPEGSSIHRLAERKSLRKK
jgi:hypothetical protein